VVDMRDDKLVDVLRQAISKGQVPILPKSYEYLIIDKKGWRLRIKTYTYDIKFLTQSLFFICNKKPVFHCINIFEASIFDCL
jgi:hypothetical protein